MRRIVLGVLAAAVGPLASLGAVPVRLSQSLWRARVLASGQDRWNRFTARAAFNSLFYWIMALNLERYGRRGVSPELATGAFPLRRWMAHGIVPLLAYRKFGAVLPLAGMLGWWLGHLFWLEAVPLWWGVLLLVLTAINTTTYSNTFVLQNYNVAGWAVFSAGLYALMAKELVLLSLAWLFVSFMSPTVLLFGGAATIAVAFVEREPLLLLALVPAGLKMLTHFWYLVTDTKSSDALGFIARGIGITKQGARYKHHLKVKPVDVYLFVLYVQFIVVAWVRSGQFPILTATAVAIFLVNSLLTRFADRQSAGMFVASAIAADAFLRPDWLVLISFWYAISPGAAFVQWDRRKRYIFDVPVYEPFSLERARECTEEFLRPVPDGARVFMAFKDPGESHSKVFDQLGPWRELFQYIAILRRIHLMPDWWAVFDLNYPDAPSLWGRDPHRVAENLTRWNAPWAIIYRMAGDTLPSEWEEAGFVPRTHLPLAEIVAPASGERLAGLAYEIWLLEGPSAHAEEVTDNPGRLET